MKYFFLLGLMVTMSTGVLSQHGEGGDTCDVWNVTVNDNTCNSSGCASSQPFTAPNCPHLYLIATSGPHCKATATVYTYPGGQFVMSESNSDEQGSCGGTAWNEIYLTAGEQYKLTVCYESCPSPYTCNDCTQYVGQGRVWVLHP